MRYKCQCIMNRIHYSGKQKKYKYNITKLLLIKTRDIAQEEQFAGLCFLRKKGDHNGKKKI